MLKGFDGAYHQLLIELGSHVETAYGFYLLLVGILEPLGTVNFLFLFYFVKIFYNYGEKGDT